MVTTTHTLPDLGVPVSLPPGMDLEVLQQLSVGELAYVNLVVQQHFAQRLADPATAHEFAQFVRASGADWSGHDLPPPPMDAAAEADASTTDEPTNPDGTPVITPRPTPMPPDNACDTIPVIAEMLRRIQHAQDAAITHFVRHLQPVFTQQPEFLGTPEGINAFKDSTAYCTDVLRLSRQTTKKLHDRLPYVTWNPGQDPTMGVHQPKLPKLADAFRDGTIPAENLDRIVALDADLTKYVHTVGARPEYKDEILRAFEPTLIEGAQTSTPDSFSAARRRWADKIAHHIDQDGPSIADTIRKKADNIIRDQAYADGSGKIWMHATPDVFAEYKNFALNQLNKNGAPVKVDDTLAEFLYQPANDADSEGDDRSGGDDRSDEGRTSQDTETEATASPESAMHTNREARGQNAGLFDDLEADHPLPNATLEDLTIARDPKAVVAAEDNGNPVSQEDLETIDALTPGQLLGAILIGAFKAMLTMEPDELQLKTSHGAASTLTIIQDLETAYKTLGVGAIPKDAQRPRGPHGIIPTVLTRPNPDAAKTPSCTNPEHLFGHSPPPWTGYISEGLNIGALHPKDAEVLACDCKLVGQIWAQHHAVLNQRRAQRIFTTAQRHAILARDRGCQAPGCTIIAAWCQLHHLKPWELGGTTDVDNAITLCAHHHAAVHNGKWTIRTINGTHFFQPAPWLDPTQPLLRNMYWVL